MLRRESLIPFVLVLCIGLFFLFTLRDGHRWGDDFAMYLLHTRNLAEGLPYSFGYVYNPAEPHMGPPAYPPLFPLLLLPVYKVAGLNYSLLKGVVILTFLVFLWALFVVSSRYLAWGWRVALVALMGFQPYLWNGKDDILSDLPFLMFLYLGLVLAESLNDRPPNETRPLWQALVLGVVLCLPYSTRNVGLAIIPAFLLYDVWKQRRLTLFACTATLVAAVLALAESRLLRTAGGYGGLFDPSPLWLAHNTVFYIKATRVFLLNGYSNLVSYGIFVIALCLAAWGAWHQLRRGVHLLELLALIYLPLIIAYKVPGLNRYLLPILPLFFIYMLTGLQALLATVRPALRAPIVSAAVLLIALTYAGAYAKSEWGPIREGANDPDFRDACQYLRQHATPSDVVIFRKPRLLALLTGLQAAIYNTTGSPETIRAFAHQVHARYIVLAVLSHEDFASDQQNLLPCVERYRDEVKEVYVNPHYRIFALQPEF